jgi:predicted aldo/keto reductase-like oxidoreductase
VLANAHAKGIGVVAMKTLRGARLNDMRPFETQHSTFAQTAFRWTLSDPHVDALVVSMTDKKQIDEYVAASGAPAPTGAELDLLEEYSLANAGAYCNHGCEICHGACPSGVAVNEVLRTRMYAVDYGNHEYARAEYRNLNANAADCLGCSGTPCLGQCPSGLAISDLTTSAHRLLA